MPRLILWIRLIKVSKKGSVRKFPQARAVICHSIRRSSNVLEICVVTMVAPVETADTKEVGGGVPRSNRTSHRSGDSWCVIIEHRNGSLPNIEVLCQDVLVADDSCKFKVTVGKVPRWICTGDEAMHNIVWKPFPPN